MPTGSTAPPLGFALRPGRLWFARRAWANREKHRKACLAFGAMNEEHSEPGTQRSEIARVAYSIARAALNEQHATVRDLRARTGALLTATSVVVSFLGARALTTIHLRGLAFLGLGVFVLSLVLSLYVLLPTKKIKSLAAGGVLLDSPHPQRDPATDAYQRLAETCDRISVTNESHIEVLGRVFTLASAAIVIEVLLWGLQLALS
jgi:hypothetical protein